MPYDLQSARQAGVSDAEIADALAPKLNYDLQAARGAGIPDTEIAEVLATKFNDSSSTEPRSMPERVGRALGLTARAGVQGVTGLPTLALDALSGLAGYPGAVSQAQRRLLDRVLPSPENTTERVAGNIASALSGTGAISSVARMAAPATEMGKHIARSFAANVPAQSASAVAGSAAGAAANEAGLPWWAQTLASFTGGAAPTVAAPKFFGRFAESQQPDIPTRVPANVETFRAAGTAPSVGQATESNFYRGLENMLSRFPGGQKVISSFRERQQEQMGATTATGGSAEAAGRAIEKGITGEGGFLQRTSQQWRQLDDRLAAQVGNDTMVPPTKTIETLDRLVARVEDPAINKVLQNPKIVELGSAIAKSAKATKTSTEFGPEHTMPVTTVGTPGMLSFQTLRETRKEFGRLLDDKSISPDFKKAELSTLYGALSEDIKEAARRSGDASLSTWSLQNRLWRGRQERVDGVLDKVLGNNKSYEDMFLSINPRNADQMTTLRTTMKSLLPEERQIVTDAVVARLGKASPGRQNETGEVFSSETFLTNYNKMSRQAKEVLFPNLTQRNAVESLAAAASNIRDSNKIFYNSSNTTGTGAPYALGGMVFSGPLGAATATGLVVGARIGAQMLTDPRTLQWLSQSTKIRPGQMSSHLARLQTIFNNTDDDTLKQELRDYMESVGGKSD